MSTALSRIESRFLDHAFAAARAQAPYVWGGKGDQIWTPNGIIANPFGRDVFDCSGLITTCLFRAGGPDLRFSHGAKQLRDLFPAHAPPYGDELVCRFYPGHIALKLCSGSRNVGVLEAAGGGHLTTAPTSAGYARCNRETRGDFEAEGSLSAYLQGLYP